MDRTGLQHGSHTMRSQVLVTVYKIAAGEATSVECLAETPPNNKYCDSMLSGILTTMSSQLKPVHIDIFACWY